MSLYCHKEDLLLKLFDEVEFAWPQLGYPPLVTPFSQYVKNVALMNVIQEIKGKERWSMIDENTWGMLLGKSGQLLGPLGEEIVGLAKAQKREFYTGNPQDLYPDELELFAAKMDEKGWDYGEDDEELMEYAMHPSQYEDYKSGKAKKNFLEDLQKRKESEAIVQSQPTATPQPIYDLQPKVLNLDVNGEKFKVSVSYDENETITPSTPAPATNTPQPTNTVTEKIEGKSNGNLKRYHRSS